MITHEEIEKRFKESAEVAYVKVTGDGYHYQLTVVSDAFIGKTKVARQQWVYAKLKNEITTGSLHALSIQTWTLDEWEKKHG